MFGQNFPNLYLVILFFTVVTDCYTINRNKNNDHYEYVKQYENWTIEVDGLENFKVIKENETADLDNNVESNNKREDKLTGLALIDRCTDTNGVSHNCDLRMSHCDPMLTKCVSCAHDCSVERMKAYAKTQSMCEQICPVYLVTEAQTAKLRSKLLQEQSSRLDTSVDNNFNVVPFDAEQIVWILMTLVLLLLLMMFAITALIVYLCWSSSKQRKTFAAIHVQQIDQHSAVPYIGPTLLNKYNVGGSIKATAPACAEETLKPVETSPESTPSSPEKLMESLQPVVAHSTNTGQHEPHLVPSAGQSQSMVDISSSAKQKLSKLKAPQSGSFPRCHTEMTIVTEATSDAATSCSSTLSQADDLRNNTEEYRPLLDMDSGNSSYSAKN